MISSSAKVYKNVILGKNIIIEDFCEVGVPPRNQQDGSLPTIIGDNAHIRSFTTIYAGNMIGNNFQTGHKTNIRENSVIGDNVSIGTLSVLEHHVTIGNDVRIHTQAFIPEFSVLRDNVWIGPNVVLTNSLYPNNSNSKNNLKGPIINEKSILGANSTILPGVSIGKEAIVGAGAVVVKDVAEGCVVAGNPAKPISKRSGLAAYNGEIK